VRVCVKRVSILYSSRIENLATDSKIIRSFVFVFSFFVCINVRFLFCHGGKKQNKSETTDARGEQTYLGEDQSDRSDDRKTDDYS